MFARCDKRLRAEEVYFWRLFIGVEQTTKFKESTTIHCIKTRGPRLTGNYSSGYRCAACHTAICSSEVMM
jgi:hypothetical protein